MSSLHSVHSPLSNPTKSKEELTAAMVLVKLGDCNTIRPLQNQESSLLTQKVLLDTGRNEEKKTTSCSYEKSRDIAKRVTFEADVEDKKFEGLSFVQKLHKILSDTRFSDTIQWLEGYDAFIFLDKKKFSKEILSTHFNESKFTSFTRRLSRWHFHRIPRGRFQGAYYHKYFKKNHYKLCGLMLCDEVKMKKQKLLLLGNKHTDASNIKTGTNTKIILNKNQTKNQNMIGSGRMMKKSCHLKSQANNNMLQVVQEAKKVLIKDWILHKYGTLTRSFPPQQKRGNVIAFKNDSSTLITPECPLLELKAVQVSEADKHNLEERRITLSHKMMPSCSETMKYDFMKAPYVEGQLRMEKLNRHNVSVTQSTDTSTAKRRVRAAIAA
jgi:predicted GNAT family acetyltransferase